MFYTRKKGRPLRLPFYPQKKGDILGGVLKRGKLMLEWIAYTLSPFAILWISYIAWTGFLLSRKFPDFKTDFLRNPVYNIISLFFLWPYLFSLVSDLEDEVVVEKKSTTTVDSAIPK